MKTYLLLGAILYCSIRFSISSLSQDTLLFQSFENTNINYNLSTPICNNAPDNWGPITTINNYNPTDAGHFWGIRDLNGSCGGNSFESIEFIPVNISNYNYVELTLDYFYHEFDNGDDIILNYSYDNSSSQQIVIVDGYSNISSGGWQTHILEIPDSIQQFYFSIEIKQNGDNDYAGFDKVMVTGVHEDSAYLHDVITDSILCINNSSSNNALDDHSKIHFQYQGQNLSDTLIINSNYTTQDTFYYGQQVITTLPSSVFHTYSIDFQDLHSTNTHYILNIDSLGHCSNSYSLGIDSLSSTSVQVNCFNGDSIYTYPSLSGTFHNSNIFHLLLEHPNGDTDSIYHTNSTSLDSVILLNIPKALNQGNYQIILKSSYPEMQAINTNIQINNALECKSPHINSIVVNACASGEYEGSGEFIFGNTGNYTVDLSQNFQLYYGSSTSFSTNNLKIDQFVHNSINTDALNMSAGCSNLFIDAYNQNLPPFSKFLICRNDLDINSYFWNGLCAQGPIYVLYATNSTWLDFGIFSNSTTPGTRYIKSTFMDTLNNIHENINAYERSLNSGNDGDEITFVYDSVFPVLYSNNNCYLSGNFLSVELLYFKAINTGESIELSFSFKDEKRFNKYRIEKYEDGSWNTLEGVNKNTTIPHYTCYDPSPIHANDYRLIAIDNNGIEETLEYTFINFQRESKKIVSRLNFLGQKIQKTYKGYHLIKYKDGSTSLVYKD